MSNSRRVRRRPQTTIKGARRPRYSGPWGRIKQWLGMV
jgi:hypothetical protein